MDDAHGHDHGPDHGHAVLDVADRAAPPHRDPPGISGLLTPAAVRNQVFKVVRLREGYDLAEVDRFLGLMEATLISVLRDNENLRARAAEQGESQAFAGESAARIVDVAQEAADRTLALAHEEARAILARARQQAEQVEHAALDMAAALQREARGIPREVLASHIHSLHTFIAAFGSGLKDTLDGQIDRLHSLLDELNDIDPAHEAVPPPQHDVADVTADGLVTGQGASHEHAM